MEQLKHQDHTYTTNHTDVEKTENVKNTSEKLQQSKHINIPPVYDMRGNLSTRHDSSSNGMMQFI